MATIVQIRHDTAADWLAANPVLAQGEMALETDTMKLKCGDGLHQYSFLNYYAQFTLANGSLPVTALITTGTPSATTFLNGLGAYVTPVSGFSRVPVIDANYTITATTSTILAYSGITAARVLTLPPASTSGQLIWVVDESGALNSSISLTIQRAGADTIEGQTSFILTGQYAALCLESSGSGQWTILTYEELPVAVADASYVVPFREDCIIQVNSLTAPRTITLPPATTSGQRVTVMDMSGAASSSKIISVVAAGTDTINGATSSPYLINAAYGQIVLVSNGAGKWAYSIASSNIALGTNFTEYAYNNSTSTTSDSTSFANGPTGAVIQRFAPTGTASIQKLVQFLNPIQPSDLIVLEVWNGFGWVTPEMAGIGYNNAGASTVGIGVNVNTSNQVVVNFFSAPGNGNPWSAYTANWKWRVRKVSQGNMAQLSVGMPFTLGDGATKTFTLTHNMGTAAFTPTAWELTGLKRNLGSSAVFSNPTATQVTVDFATAPAANSVLVLLSAPTGTLSPGDRLSSLAQQEVGINAAATATTAAWNHCTATSAAYALTLPPVQASAGKIVGVRVDKASTFIVTVTGNAAELIDGVNTFPMIAGATAEFKSDGLTWTRVSSNGVSGTTGVFSGPVTIGGGSVPMPKYDEGAWIPVATSLGGTGISYSAKWIQIGNKVDFSLSVGGTGLTATAATTTLSIPFTPARTSTAAITLFLVGASSSASVTSDGLIHLPTIASTSQINISGTIFLT